MDTGSLWPEKPMEPRKRPLWRPKRRLLGGEGVEKTLRTKFARKSQAKTQNYLMCFALYAGNCLRPGTETWKVVCLLFLLPTQGAT